VLSSQLLLEEKCDIAKCDWNSAEARKVKVQERYICYDDFPYTLWMPSQSTFTSPKASSSISSKQCKLSLRRHQVESFPPLLTFSIIVDSAKYLSWQHYPPKHYYYLRLHDYGSQLLVMLQYALSRSSWGPEPANTETKPSRC